MSKKSPAKVRTSQRAKFLVLAVPLFIILAILTGNYTKSVSAEKKEKAAEDEKIATAAKLLKQTDMSEEKMRAWPLPPYPKRRFEVQKPAIPKMPPVQFVLMQDGMLAKDSFSLRERIRLLIQEHPIDEIRNDLNRMIENGEILLNFQVEENSSAQYKVVTKNQITWSSHTIDSEDEYFLTLTVNPDWLAMLGSSRTVVEGLLVIYHEYQHHKQYIASNPEDRKVWEESHRPNTEITQERACDLMWRAEKEAYAAECRIANAWGVKMSSDLCMYVDTGLWKQAMFNLMQKEITMFPICDRVFATNAGHPHPKLF